MSRKNYFLLRGIHPQLLDQKYGFHLSYSFDSKEVPENATKVMDLVPVRTSSSALAASTSVSKEIQFSYLDECKKEHQCIATMSQMTFHDNNPTYLPMTTIVHCFWCRHEFDFRPVGCPIQYVPHRASRSYQSEITKENYILRENLTELQKQALEKHKDNYATDISVHDRDFYIVDGLFCSFNCCLAFIREIKTSNVLYLYSENLLHQFYHDVFGQEAAPLEPAPSWRLLKAYGGHQTIEEFRKNFYKVLYKDIDNILFPVSKPIGFLFEKQIKI